MLSTPLGPPILGKPVCAMKITYRDDNFCVHLEDGRIICTPLAWFRTLDLATPKQLKKGQVIAGGTGLAWDDLDEHISVESLLSPSPLYRRADRGPVTVDSLMVKK